MDSTLWAGGINCTSGLSVSPKLHPGVGRRCQRVATRYLNMLEVALGEVRLESIGWLDACRCGLFWLSVKLVR